MLFSLVPKFIYVLLLAALPTTAVAVSIRSKNRFPGAIIPILAMGAVCLMGYGAFWAFFASMWFGHLFVGAVYLASSVQLFRMRKLLPQVLWHECELRTVWMLMLFIGCGYLAILCGQDKSGDGLVLPAHRWLDLPTDNLIPVLFADRLENGAKPLNLFGDWLSSDRPPLQTGVILLLRPPLLALGFKHVAVAASQWFQLLWIPGLWALLRTLGAKPKVAAAIVAVTACTGFCLIHSVYTWPKLGAAAMVFGGGSLVLSKNVQSAKERWAYSAGFFALAHLSHGGGDFSILALAPIVCWKRWRPDLKNFVLGAAVFGVLVAPWIAYQKYYDPPGNRLLKWHLAGVIDLDQRPFTQALVESYRELGWQGAWQNRRVNFSKLFDGEFTQIVDFSMRNERAATRRGDEFYWVFRALAFGNIALLALPFSLWWYEKKIGENQAGPEILFCFGWLALTLLVGCLVGFIPGSVAIHQGSLATPVTLFALSMFLMVSVGWRWFMGLAGLQLLSFITTWWPATPGSLEAINIKAVMLLVLCTVGVVSYISSMENTPAQVSLSNP